MTTLQIAIITGAGCLWLGYIGCSLFDLYRKGGQRDLENWLDAEVEQNVKLLQEIEDRENSDFPTAGAQEGAGVESGHVDTPAPSSSVVGYSCPQCKTSGIGLPDTFRCDFDGTPWDIGYREPKVAWNCEERGHRYVTTNINGNLTRACMHCPHDGGSAA